MHRNKLKMIILLMLIISICFFIGCSDYEAKNYEVSGIDAIAAEILSDTVSTDILTAGLKTLEDGLQLSYSNGVKDTISSFITTDVLKSLKDSVAVFSETEKNYFIKRAAKECYVNLDLNSSGETVIYATDYVKLQLISGTDTLSVKDTTIPLELISGAFHNEGEHPESIVKLRYVYDLESKEYLLKIIGTEQTMDNEMHFAIVKE